jgi:pilus assembly protein FimV
MTRGQGDDWAQAAALGLSIDPLNPLYASNAAHDEVAADATATPAAVASTAAHEPLSFDQHFAGAMGTAQPSFEPEAAAAAASAAPVEDEHALDFDLGGLAFEPVQAEEPKPAMAENDEHVLDFDMGGFEMPVAAPAEAANTQAAAEEPLDFSFDDMDFGAPAANPVPQPVVQTSVHTAQADDDLPFGDFDLGDTIPAAGPASTAATSAAETTAQNSDFDMASLAREFDLDPPAAPEQTSPANELKDPLFDLDAMDFGLADETAPAQPESAAAAADFAPASAPARSLEDELFGLPDLPTAAPAPVETAEYAPHDMLEPQKVEADFDLGGFDLDLPGEHTQSLAEAGTVSAPAMAPAETSGAHMEMETKLDLAIAYQEIGDKEGARELLEEVIKGGNSEQVNKANAMRAQLA